MSQFAASCVPLKKEAFPIYTCNHFQSNVKDIIMASSGGKIMKGAKKAASKIQAPPFLKTDIPAGKATPAPPLGPQLGAVGHLVYCSGYG